MRKITLNIFLILTLSTELFSQFSGLDSSGFVGDFISVQIQYNGNFETEKVYKFESDLFISNPTIFYPVEFLAGDNTKINDYELNRINDSTYKVSINIQFLENFTPGNIIFKLRGELLAGNDSVTTLNFTNIKLNDSLNESFGITVKSTTEAGFIQYVRFARITKYYPNPLTIGEKLHVDYYIDKKSKIVIRLYDLIGNYVLTSDEGIIDIGIHSFEFTPDKSFSAGLYWIYLETNSGNSHKPVVIIK